MTDQDHLSAELIAAYLASEASPVEQELVQKHLLTCAECRGDVAEAAELSIQSTPRRWIKVAIPAAAAALLLFALVPGQRPGPDESLTRGPDVEGVQHFAIVIPEEGASVSIDSLEFLWRSEGPEVHYLLTVTDENGDIVWTGATRDTSLAPPREAAFSSDETYYWYVDALLEGASSSTTGVREFSIRP